MHHLNLQYNCLHDPHLQDYHKRKDILRMLKKQGCVTSENKVGLDIRLIKNSPLQAGLPQPLLQLLLLPEDRAVCWCPWEQKQHQHPPGKPQTCPSQPAPRCLFSPGWGDSSGPNTRVWGEGLGAAPLPLGSGCFGEG